MKKSMQLLAVLSTLAFSFLSAPFRAVHASTTWYVTKTADTFDGVCDSDCSLRDAISVATSGDAIDFGSVTGTITLTGGPLNINGQNITITGPGAASLTIDGNNAGRIFFIYSSTVSMSGLTLTHGLVNNATTADPNDLGGGAIESYNGTHLTLDQMVITGNTVNCSPCNNNGLDGLGGAIASLTNCALTITNSSITNNTSLYGGGGVYFNAANSSVGNTLSMTNVSVTGNQATDTTIGDGGGILVSYGNSTTLTNVTVVSNTAGNAGGGLFDVSQPMTVTNSTFDLNQAHGTTYQGGGGGIYLASPATLIMGGSTFADNSTGANGGGLYLDSTVVLIYNSTFAGNSAAGSTGGGGIYSHFNTLTLLNSTIAGNSATSTHGAGFLVYGGTDVVKNTIFAGSTGGASDCDSGLLSWAGNVNNIVQTNDGIQPCNVEFSGVDPVLGPLASNGGPTQTMALLAGSPAIDTGDASTCASAGSVNNLDQRGRPRPADGDHNGTSICDIGAYEVPVFADLPVTGKEWMERWVNGFYEAGVTTGCGVSPLIYCPENNVTREEMAVFILRAIHGKAYTPPNVTGIFADMPVAGKEWMEPWVDEFYNEGLTTGCGVSPLIFCPTNNVTREEMAVFILRAIHIHGWAPPVTSGLFADMPVTGKEWMESWVDEFYNEGITSGCGVSPLIYCPTNNVTRAEMAVFIDRAFHLYP